MRTMLARSGHTFYMPCEWQAGRWRSGEEVSPLGALDIPFNLSGPDFRVNVSPLFE